MTTLLIGQSDEYKAVMPKLTHQKILSVLQHHMPRKQRIHFERFASQVEASDDDLRVPLGELGGIGDVRAELTDHGSVEALREHSGIHVNSQYSVALTMEIED